MYGFMMQAVELDAPEAMGKQGLGLPLKFHRFPHGNGCLRKERNCDCARAFHSHHLSC